MKKQLNCCRVSESPLYTECISVIIISRILQPFQLQMVQYWSFQRTVGLSVQKKILKFVIFTCWHSFVIPNLSHWYHLQSQIKHKSGVWLILIWNRSSLLNQSAMNAMLQQENHIIQLRHWIIRMASPRPRVHTTQYPGWWFSAFARSHHVGRGFCWWDHRIYEGIIGH